jgi:hypothetical protein
MAGSFPFHFWIACPPACLLQLSPDTLRSSRASYVSGWDNQAWAAAAMLAELTPPGSNTQYLQRLQVSGRVVGFCPDFALPARGGPRSQETSPGPRSQEWLAGGRWDG